MRTALQIAALTLVASSAFAQDGRVYPVRRHFLVFGEALATGAGGVLNGTSIMHAMRVGGVFTVYGRHGIDVTAARFQTIFPPGGRINDYEYANPEGDALILSWAQLNRTRARGFPNSFVLGGGVVRRNTAEAGRTRDTWIARVGYDSDAFFRMSHLDTGVGFQAYFTKANANSVVYIATLGLVIRIG